MTTIYGDNLKLKTTRRTFLFMVVPYFYGDFYKMNLSSDAQKPREYMIVYYKGDTWETDGF